MMVPRGRCRKVQRVSGAYAAQVVESCEERAPSVVDGRRWTIPAIVASAGVLELALLFLVVPTALRPVGIDHAADKCGCGAGGTALGWLLVGGAVFVPVLAAIAVVACRRAQRRSTGPFAVGGSAAPP